MNPEQKQFKIIRFLTIFLWIFFYHNPDCLSQAPKVLTAQEYLSSRGEVYFKFVNANLDISLISKTISIDRVINDTIYAYANAKGFKSFLNLNLPYETLTPPSLQINQQKTKSTLKDGLWNYYPSYDEYTTMMDSFGIKYPSVAKVYEIGTSVNGRKLLFVKISDNVLQKEAEPEFMFTSTMHGDEVTGYVLMLHLIDYLLSNYGKDSLVTDLVNHVEIWINPLSNPDGTYKAGNSSVTGATRFNANNVDLNRNYPDPQGGQHPDGEAWQPENIAMMNFMGQHHFVLSANYHGGSEVLNYPWDTWSRPHPDQDWFQLVAKEYADTAKKFGGSNYFSDVDSSGITDGYQWYPVQGGRQDYTTYFLHGREITIEVSEPKMPASSDLTKYWDYNYKAMLHYIQECQYGIRGIIADSVTGEPIIAKIEVIGHDTDSSFVYSDLKNGDYYRLIYPGSYDLKFSSPGYIAKTFSNIDVDRPKNAYILNVKLDKLATSIDSQNIIVKVHQDPLSFELILQTTGLIHLELYDIAGRKVYQPVDKKLPAGVSTYTVGNSLLGSGIYFCKISFNGYQQDIIKFVKL